MRPLHTPVCQINGPYRLHSLAILKLADVALLAIHKRADIRQVNAWYNAIGLYTVTKLLRKSSMYWKYPGSATVSLWVPFGSSRHTFGALHILCKRAMWEALLRQVSDQVPQY